MSSNFTKTSIRLHYTCYTWWQRARYVYNCFHPNVKTKKQEKCSKDEVLKLVKDSLDEKIRKTCEKLLESLSQSPSINLNATGNTKG